jgi:dephospho-CoA kinase
MRTRIIGLTGGIGSGKSTIAGFYESLGVPVYIADDEAKKILYTPEATKDLVIAFGESILTKGVPDKAKIASVVFNDNEKLEMLNGIIHPKVRQHFIDWVTTKKDEPIVIKEAAILFESGSYKDCDKIILVTAPKETRISRVMKRDKVSREQVLERMAAQWDDDKKAALSDYIIVNEELEKAKAEAVKILKKIKK